MQEIDYKAKIEALLDHYKFSTKLAEALGVHRMSIPNWREGSVEISQENKLKIDIQYTMHCILPTLQKSDIDTQVRQLEKEDHTPYIDNIEISTQIGLNIAFGSLEVEVADADEGEFYRVVREGMIEKDIEKRRFLEMNNLAFVTNQIISDTASDKLQKLDTEIIKKWHFGLMNGIRDDAGSYSTHMRIIPDTKITLTAPEDIPEEMEYWTNKYAEVRSITDISYAHEHFELIHPFGDGNGRVGRLIMTHQFIQLGLLPPLIDASNKAFYYVALEKAQTSGDILPLVYFLIRGVEWMKEKLGVDEKRLKQ